MCYLTYRFTKEGLQYACTNLKRNRGLWDRMTKGEEVRSTARGQCCYTVK